MPTNNVTDTDHVRAHHEPGTTASLCSAFKQIGKDLGIMLSNAFRLNQHNQAETPRNTPTPAAGGPAPNNAAAAAPNAAAPNAAAPNAAGAAAAPPPTNNFDSKAWLKDQCSQISEALDKKTPAGRNKRDFQLNELYKAAQTLRLSLVDQRNDITNSLPPDFRADFDANVAIIANYFDSPDKSRCMSQHELRFFKTYIHFLKTCVAGTDAELNKSLEKISKSLSDVLAPLTTAIDEAEAEVKTANDTATNLETEAMAARAAATAAEATFQAKSAAQRERPKAINTRDTAIRRATNAEREATTARTTANNTTEEHQDLLASPEGKTVQRFEQSLEAINNDLTTLQQHVRDLQANNEPQSSIDAVNTRIREKRQLRAEAAGRLNYAETKMQDRLETTAAIKTATIDLVSTTQTLEIKSLQLGGDVGNFGNQVIKHAKQQLQEVVGLARADKNHSSKWLKFAETFNDAVASIEMRGTDAIALPEGFRAEPTPQNESASLKHGGQTIYELARDIVDNNLPNTDINLNDKKLALIILGAYCTEQSVRNTRSWPKIAYEKAFYLLESSAILLAASQSLKNPGTEISAVRTALCDVVEKIKTIQKAKQTELSNLNKLSETLKSLPDNTTIDDVKTAFERGINLTATENMAGRRSGLAKLFELAQTNRTFENDMVPMPGASRQAVYKKSMLRAVEILGPLPDDEAAPKDTRMSRVGSLISKNLIPLENDHIKNLIGLGDDARLNADSELLDQLVIASIAHNDLTTEENAVSRGSLRDRAKNYERNTTIESLKNHDLTGFSALSNTMIKVAMGIREAAGNRVDEMITRLENNNPPVTGQEIQQLVKYIIVTTDLKAANHENFNLKQLLDSADQLIQSNSKENRDAFHGVLTNVKTAWRDTNTEENPIGYSSWLLKDQRSNLDKTLKANPIKSVPFLNKTPVVSRLTAVTSNIAKYLVIGSAGAAGGAVIAGAGIAAVAGVIGGAVVAAPVVGAYQAMKRAR